MTENCNDYIISQGEFVRDFDAMYRDFEDPWSQEKRGVEDVSFNLLTSGLKFIFRGKKMIDIGCGPGHLSGAFVDSLKVDQYIGCDISEAAVSKAKIAYPAADFRVLNIIEESLPEKADLVTALKTLYYCAPEIDVTIRNIKKMLGTGGLLAYSYNIKEDSFTKKFLDIETLRAKLENAGFEKKLISDYYIKDERIAIDVFEKKAD